MELIRRVTSREDPELVIYWEDPELAAKGLGRIEVVVRAADRPARAVQQAQIIVRLAGEETSEKRLLTNEGGVVYFDSMPVGPYQFLVRAIGFKSAVAEIRVLPGCRTDVEAYIAQDFSGLHPEPPRVRVTTCSPAK